MNSQNKKYLIIDRDGTLIVKHHYLSDPNLVKLFPKAVEALRWFTDLGLGLIVVTNQSPIGQGLLTLEQLDLIHQKLINILKKEKITLDAIYFCPHIPEDNCVCRKPQPGLLHRASKDHQFNLTECIVIGDNASDIDLGKAVGARTILVRTGEGVRVESEKRTNPDHIVDDLYSSVPIIEKLLK